MSERSLDLTAQERIFLREQGLSEQDVFDARGLPKAVWEAEAKRLGRPLILGSPCNALGHRIRTRKGHCAQCDTSRIRYLMRHEEEASVYVAYSIAMQLSKIGVSQQLDVRERKINLDGYAGASDWEVLFSIVTTRAGNVETSAQNLLDRYRVATSYQKDRSKAQISREAFKCHPLFAIEAVIDTLRRLSVVHKAPYTSPKLKSIPVK